MTDTLPYDKRGSYSILHNHLRAYEQARLQRLANGNGNEAARARMKIANLNLQADAARRVRQDSDVTLVAGAAASKLEALSDDSDTEGEDDTTQDASHKGTEQVTIQVKESKEKPVVVEKELMRGDKGKKGGRRKRMKEKISNMTFTTFSGYVPKPRGPEFAIYPI